MDMECTDVLIDILRHLPPRSLAACRCVCKGWRATVDHHRLLRADLLPLSLDAVIWENDCIGPPMLFARRSTARYITSRLDYLEEDPEYGMYAGEIKDCCNGLLLIQNNKVVNPATRQWAQFPQLPCECSPYGYCGRCCRNNRYLVYDPAISPHYEVFFIPRIPCDVPDDMASSMEWPPSQYTMYVFSSKTECWEERSFMREGDAAGTIGGVKSLSNSDQHLYYPAYWQGSLYVPTRQRHGDFLLRINLSNEKYQVIELPKGALRSLYRLGKSEKGVYCVLYIDGRCAFQVWFLNESCGLIDWVLKNEINLEPLWRKYFSRHPDDGPWISQSSDQDLLLLKNDVDLKLVDEYNEALAEDDFEWDSDDENVVSTGDWPKKCSPNTQDYLSLDCLGFHPYKEIVLFREYHGATVAYHLNSSKVRYLGELDPEMNLNHYGIEISFAYTPCWTMDLPGSK
uniref:F-box domain-containing protein n=1 Tax=Hordeum vulgare subsp. vulgare TaxID=112509 RepID=A0A8I6Y563_HORVV